MTDPYRYLPRGLHEALAVPWDVPWNVERSPSPIEITRDGRTFLTRNMAVDLANPHGWDHAVRAYASIKGVRVGESESVAFRWDGDWACWGIETDGGTDTAHDGLMAGDRQEPIDGYTPAGRREALCRCICAALGLDVGAVFP